MSTTMETNQPAAETPAPAAPPTVPPAARERMDRMDRHDHAAPINGGNTGADAFGCTTHTVVDNRCTKCGLTVEEFCAPLAERLARHGTTIIPGTTWEETLAAARASFNRAAAGTAVTFDPAALAATAERAHRQLLNAFRPVDASCPVCGSADTVAQVVGPVSLTFECLSCGNFFCVDTPTKENLDALATSSRRPNLLTDEQRDLCRTIAALRFPRTEAIPTGTLTPERIEALVSTPPAHLGPLAWRQWQAVTFELAAQVEIGHNTVRGLMARLEGAEARAQATERQLAALRDGDGGYDAAQWVPGPDPDDPLGDSPRVLIEDADGEWHLGRFSWEHDGGAPCWEFEGERWGATAAARWWPLPGGGVDEDVKAVAVPTAVPGSEGEGAGTRGGGKNDGTGGAELPPPPESPQSPPSPESLCRLITTAFEFARVRCSAAVRACRNTADAEMPEPARVLEVWRQEEEGEGAGAVVRNVQKQALEIELGTAEIAEISAAEISATSNETSELLAARWHCDAVVNYPDGDALCFMVWAWTEDDPPQGPMQVAACDNMAAAQAVVAAHEAYLKASREVIEC